MLSLKNFFGSPKVPYSFTTKLGQYLTLPGYNPYPKDERVAAGSSRSGRSAGDEKDNFIASDKFLYELNQRDLEQTQQQTQLLMQEYENTKDPTTLKQLTTNIAKQNQLDITLNTQKSAYTFRGEQLRSQMTSLGEKEGNKVALVNGDFQIDKNGKLMVNNDVIQDIGTNVNTRYRDSGDFGQIDMPLSTGTDEAQVTTRKIANNLKDVYNQYSTYQNDKGQVAAIYNATPEGKIIQNFVQSDVKDNYNALQRAGKEMMNGNYYSEMEKNQWKQAWGAEGSTVKTDKGWKWVPPQNKVGFYEDDGTLTDKEKDELVVKEGIYPKANLSNLHESKETFEKKVGEKNIKVTKGTVDITLPQYIAKGVVSQIDPLRSKTEIYTLKNVPGDGSGGDKDKTDERTWFQKEIEDPRNRTINAQSVLVSKVSDPNDPNQQKDASSAELATAEEVNDRRVAEYDMIIKTYPKVKDDLDALNKQAIAENTTIGALLKRHIDLKEGDKQDLGWKIANVIGFKLPELLDRVVDSNMIRMNQITTNTYNMINFDDKTHVGAKKLRVTYKPVYIPSTEKALNNIVPNKARIYLKGLDRAIEIDQEKYGKVLFESFDGLLMGVEDQNRGGENTDRLRTKMTLTRAQLAQIVGNEDFKVTNDYGESITLIDKDGNPSNVLKEGKDWVGTKTTSARFEKVDERTTNYNYVTDFLEGKDKDDLISIYVYTDTEWAKRSDNYHNSSKGNYAKGNEKTMEISNEQ